MKRAIFVSYRRDDAEGEAGRLYDDLARAYGPSSVFIDVSGITPGSDFRKAIDDNVAACSVFLALIGPRWIDIASSDGQPRLQDPSDFVRLEIASALARGIPVIPILVRNAVMPSAEQLPEGLRELAYRNAVQISHARWNMDLDLLMGALRSHIAPSRSDRYDFVSSLSALKLKRLPLFAAIITLLAIVAILVVLRRRVAAPQVTGAGQVRASASGSGARPSSTVSVDPAHIPESEAVASRKYAEMLSAEQHLDWPVEVAGDLRGTWENKKPSAFCNAVDKVEFTGEQGTKQGVYVSAWAKCGQKMIAWGAPFTMGVSEGRLEALWQFDTGSQDEESRVTLTFVLAANGLFVNSNNTLYKSPTPFPSEEQFLFTRTSGPPPPTSNIFTIPSGWK